MECQGFQKITKFQKLEGKISGTACIDYRDADYNGH